MFTVYLDILDTAFHWACVLILYTQKKGLKDIFPAISLIFRFALLCLYAYSRLVDTTSMYPEYKCDTMFTYNYKLREAKVHHHNHNAYTIIYVNNVRAYASYGMGRKESVHTLFILMTIYNTHAEWLPFMMNLWKLLLLAHHGDYMVYKCVPICMYRLWQNDM